MPAVQTPSLLRLPGTRSVLVVGTLGLWLAACATAPLETTAAGTAPVAPAESVSVRQATAEPASAPLADTPASEGRVVDEQRYRVIAVNNDEGNARVLLYSSARTADRQYLQADYLKLAEE